MGDEQFARPSAVCVRYLVERVRFCRTTEIPPAIETIEQRPKQGMIGGHFVMLGERLVADATQSPPIVVDALCDGFRHALFSGGDRALDSDVATLAEISDYVLFGEGGAGHQSSCRTERTFSRKKLARIATARKPRLRDTLA